MARTRSEGGHDATGSARPHDVALLWFRQDLRLADHRALSAALQRAERIVPVFILDQDAAGPWRPGAASLWWLHHSLASLARSLEQRGAGLVLRRGDSAAILAELVCDTGAGSVQCGEAHEPWQGRLADAVAARIGVPLQRHRVATLFDPDAIRSKGGTRYGVYGPFARACLGLPEPEQPLPAPDRIPVPERMPRSDRLQDWGLLPAKPDWAGGLRALWSPGEDGARKRLDGFLRDRLDGYGAARNVPGDPHGTSMLSPHLHWGELSPSQVWHAAKAAAADRKAARTGFESFRGELLWHDFAAYLLRHNPRMPDDPLREAYARLPWRDDAEAVRAWREGRTGVPIVDAGMRQLWQCGWMHNRVRMITASFLVKHLLVSWQEGERWFWDTLVDADLATNAASWQWIGGCGTDAQPFFRVFNPATQGRTHDPDGRYVRQYVPELAKLPDRWLHTPWLAPKAVLDRAGLTLGRDYPHPIVSLEEGRDRALAAFRDHVRAGAGRDADQGGDQGGSRNSSRRSRPGAAA